MSAITWIVIVIGWLATALFIGSGLYSIAFGWRQRVCEHPTQYPLRRCANCWVCADCYREFHQEDCGFTQHEQRS